MLEWRLYISGDTAEAKTDFATLFVDPDVRDPSAFRARVMRINNDVLRVAGDFSTLDAARDWCEAEYRELLVAELGRLDPAAQG